ncbi:TVG0266297 [Thermoplasma volcanium GSS1]|uniref:TVG0266297 protein n=1 Tax=Thermoplasma volcanium (strain ATCC 51530 / DSM 4299 / JCM 9571 / NBRC 15438 / GSS1) TaxID=273116 RepID=Q97C51_THEVO|nr:TVG0266297 [Thermoplasma volcanium GSS1]
MRSANHNTIKIIMLDSTNFTSLCSMYEKTASAIAGGCLNLVNVIKIEIITTLRYSCITPVPRSMCNNVVLSITATYDTIKESGLENLPRCSTDIR